MSAIILEGPDGAGKTTLAQQLCSEDGWRYEHTGPPSPGEDVLRSYALRLVEGIDHGPTVFDRLFLGELVYGPIMRGKSLLSPRGARLMDRLITGQGVRVIVCLPPYGVCLHNWQARKGKEYVTDFDKFHGIYTGYEILARLNPRYEVYDYTKGPYITKKWPTQIQWRNAIGQPGAPFVFLGEIANQKKLDLPFFSEEGVSPWLDDCLDAAGYLAEERIYANAYNLDKTPRDIFLMHEALRRQNHRVEIIALGRKAAARCQKHGLLHHELPHPQYWKRFQNGQRHTYIGWLKEIRENHARNHVRWVKVS